MKWTSRLRRTLCQQPINSEIAEEIQDHIDRRAAELERQGIAPGEARRRALVAFGSPAEIQEQVREHRLWTGLDQTLSDIRYACRGLLRNPAFTLTAVLSLGLATGALTAIYSIVDAAVLRPLPVSNPHQLFTLSDRDRAGDVDLFSYQRWRDLCRTSNAGTRIALFDAPIRTEAQSAENGWREDVTQQFVSPNAFDVLGVPPALGRLFSPSEDRFPAPRAVAVLSYDFWNHHYASNPEVIGKVLAINGRNFSIVGVAARGFKGPEPGKFVDVWLPVTQADPGVLTNPGFRAFRLLARSPGTPEFRDRSVAAHPGASGFSVFHKAFARPLTTLLVVAGCILLIACANVATLLLARSTVRSVELALRTSLGATRVRLLRQLLTESTLIASFAGLVGWLLAAAAGPALLRAISQDGDPIRLDLTLDTRVLVFCVAICAASALFFGLLPAWSATQTRSIAALKGATGQASRLGLSRFFVVVQLAFAFSLVTGSAAFLVSLRNLNTVDVGFDSRGVTVLTLVNRLGPAQRDLQRALPQQLRFRVSALAGVDAAATAWWAMFSGNRRGDKVIVPGKPPSQTEETFYRVSPGFFATLRTPLLAGRDFSEIDNDNEPVPTVVNRVFAERYFGTGAVVGREFRRDDGTRHQIVGVSANSHYGSLRGGAEAIAYLPMKPPRVFTLYVRSKHDAGSLARMVDREASALGSGLHVTEVTTLNRLIGRTIAREKLLAGLGGVFALLALVLAAIGLFGLLSYAVSRRTKDIGVRAALGANRSALYWLVLREVLALTGSGLGFGLAGAVLILQAARSLLFGIRMIDPMVVALATGLFLGAALIAGGLPARRAVRVDPVIALRHE